MLVLVAETAGCSKAASVLPTPTSTSTKTPDLVATHPSAILATPTPAPYPAGTKLILISYDILNLELDPIMGCLQGINTFSFVLYDDGQLIFKEEGIFKESYLSQEAVDNLISQIEATGYFEVKGDGMPENDPIYIVPTKQSGPIYETVAVKGKRVSVNYPLREYLIPPVKQTLELILKYRPPDSHIYEPEYMGVRIFLDYLEAEAWMGTPIAPVDEWPSNLPPLSSLMNASDENYYGYIDSTVNQKIKGLFRVYPSHRVFIEDGLEYHIVTCVYLPR